MNIFVLDNDPVKAAQYMDDQRVNKMIIESGQMMRAALGRHGMTEGDCRQFGILTKSGTPWRITHKNHPCTLWAGETRMNFMWLATHALALCREFEQRYLKEHACRQPIMHMIEYMEQYIPEGDYTPFAQAMPVEYKHDNAVTAYRRYYQSKDNIRYRKTDVPTWWGVTA